jgi:hypothetical protein
MNHLPRIEDGNSQSWSLYLSFCLSRPLHWDSIINEDYVTKQFARRFIDHPDFIPFLKKRQ